MTSKSSDGKNKNTPEETNPLKIFENLLSGKLPDLSPDSISKIFSEKIDLAKIFSRGDSKTLSSDSISKITSPDLISKIISSDSISKFFPEGSIPKIFSEKIDLAKIIEEFIPKEPISINDMKDKAADGLNRFGGLHTAAFGSVEKLFIQRNELMENEHKHLIAKFGDKHPRTIKMSKQLEKNIAIKRVFRTTSQINKIHKPKVSSNDMLIHGRVVDHNLQGIPKVVVSYAKRNESDMDFSSITDESGYYSIIANTGDVESILKNKIKFVIYSIDDKIIHREPEISLSTSETFHEIVLSDEKTSDRKILKPTKKTKSKKRKR